MSHAKEAAGHVKQLIEKRSGGEHYHPIGYTETKLREYSANEFPQLWQDLEKLNAEFGWLDCPSDLILLTEANYAEQWQRHCGKAVLEGELASTDCSWRISANGSGGVILLEQQEASTGDSHLRIVANRVNQLDADVPLRYHQILQYQPQHGWQLVAERLLPPQNNRENR